MKFNFKGNSHHMHLSLHGKKMNKSERKKKKTFTVWGDYGFVQAELIMMGLFFLASFFKINNRRDESNLMVELISHNIALSRSILWITWSVHAGLHRNTRFMSSSLRLMNED
jgi:hypothetical protein